MIVIRQVYYSQKHDENWYKGEETNSQKKCRKGFVGGLVGLGGALGTAGGLIADNSHRKAKCAIAKARVDDNIKEHKIGLYKSFIDPRLDPHVTSEDIETYSKRIEDLNRRLEHDRPATERFAKRARKIANKKLAKSVGKGAAIGLGIGGGLAYLANKGIKSINEKGNAARRNKYKNLKDNDNTKK